MKYDPRSYKEVSETRWGILDESQQLLVTSLKEKTEALLAENISGGEILATIVGMIDTMGDFNMGNPGYLPLTIILRAIILETSNEFLLKKPNENPIIKDRMLFYNTIATDFFNSINKLADKGESNSTPIKQNIEDLQEEAAELCQSGVVASGPEIDEPEPYYRMKRAYNKGKKDLKLGVSKENEIGHFFVYGGFINCRMDYTKGIPLFCLYICDFSGRYKMISANNYQLITGVTSEPKNFDEATDALEKIYHKQIDETIGIETGRSVGDKI